MSEIAAVTTRVLVVEDDPDDQYLIRKSLNKRFDNFELYFANDGRQALKLLDDKKNETERLPEIIILDLNMPLMGGFEFLQAKTKDEQLTSIPTIVFSTSNRASDRRKALELGASDYLVKPNNISAFNLTLNELVGQFLLKSAPQPLDEQTAAQPITKVEILYIDDDPQDFYILKKMLEKDLQTDYKLTHCATISAAHEAIIHQPFDLIMLDLNLTSSFGEDTLKMALDALSGIPVIVVTGQQHTNHEAQFIRLGAADYIQKNELNTALLSRTVKFTLERQNLLTELKQQATKDPLTGLNNRACFYSSLEKQIEQAKRNNSGLAVAFIDMDDFKPVNDIHGHNAGDQLLIQFADRLSRNLRASDFCARYGGDEFALYLTNFETAENLRQVIARKQELLTQPYNILVKGKVKQVTVGATFGVSIWRDNLPLRKFIASADSLMYEGKKQGKNSVIFSRPGSDA